MHDQIQGILIDRSRIARRIEQLAQAIAEDYRRTVGQDEPSSALVLIAIMTGSVIFLADLVRRMPLHLRMKLLSVSSYPGRATTSQGVRLLQALPDDLAGRYVLILDDVLDSGRTLTTVRTQVESQRPAAVRTCVLLRKDRPSARAVPAEFVGFDIPDQFVVGYGLDYDDLYRNLPDVVTLKRQVYA